MAMQIYDCGGDTSSIPLGIRRLRPSYAGVRPLRFLTF